MGIPTLITTNTSSNASGSAFTSSIDSTYDEYMFVCTDMHPETDNVHFEFQANASGQSGYNETVTTTMFGAAHTEADGGTDLAIRSGDDQGNGTAYQRLEVNVNASTADESCAGILHLFAPSDTTYTTRFYWRGNSYHNDVATRATFVAGYFNVTAAITNINFQFSSGNMNGVIQMYGIS
jgi:hypothetical protein